MALDKMRFAFFSSSALDHHDQAGTRVSFPQMITHMSRVTICHVPPATVYSRRS